MEQYECSCEDFTYRHVPCKHMLAVSMARATGRVRGEASDYGQGPGVPEEV